MSTKPKVSKAGRKRKGARVERELVAKLEKWGLKAKRYALSDGRVAGRPKEVDVDLWLPLWEEPVGIQVKAQNRLPLWMGLTENTPVGAFRPNGGEFLFIVSEGLMQRLCGAVMIADDLASEVMRAVDEIAAIQTALAEDASES